MSKFRIIGESKEYDTGNIVDQPENIFENLEDTETFQVSKPTLEPFQIGKYLQSAPMVFSKQGHSLWLGDMYKGRAAFLILGGPSFKEILEGHSERYDAPYIELLKQPGFLTASVNNAIDSFRTDLWFSTDKPSQFVKSVWLDPKVMKFSPFVHSEHPVYDNDAGKFTNILAGDCPNSWFFKRNDYFKADTFLEEATFNWGNLADYGGKRTVMLIAIKMLYYLGVRTIFLLGCDFYMDKNTTYHFNQKRHKSSIDSNMSTYARLKERFAELRPLFETNNFHILNCNPLSSLRTFEFIDVDDAIEVALHEFPDLKTERTEGLYDREFRIRQFKKEKAVDEMRKERTRPLISFCTACMNRTDQLKQTYIKNIEDCIYYGTDVEFVLVNYNSSDDLDEWAKQSLMKYIELGVLNYYKTTLPKNWDMSHAKNVTHRLAQGEIICNLDADNFLGDGFYEYIKDKLYLNKHAFVRKRGSGKGGRLVLHREHFYAVGGYDERMCYGWGLEDGDLHRRLERLGIKRVRSIDFDIIEHKNKERTVLAKEKDFKVSREKHQKIMDENDANKVVTVNQETGFGKTVVTKNFGDEEIELGNDNYDNKY